MANHLNLLTVLQTMCGNDDHKTVLSVLQVLGHVRRGGYMSIEEQVSCLSYCADTFAKSGNKDFFKEFVQYMPDITTSDIENPFSVESRSYYFAARDSETILNNIKLYCPDIDVDSMSTWFYDFLTKRKIYQKKSLEPLVKSLQAQGNKVSNDYLKRVCEGYTLPIAIRTGRSV